METTLIKPMPMLLIDINTKRLKEKEKVSEFSKLPPEIKVIIEAVSKDSGILVFDILRKTRKREIVTARHLCIHFIKEHTDYTLGAIGRFFSGRDHSTVIHALGSINDQLDTDRKFRNNFNRLSTIVANEVYIHNICSEIPAKIF